jgi:uncharacterized protein YdeI (YjbR/CyaY-like superfamily)
MNPKVDGFINRATSWRLEMTELRSIVLEFGLTEELKWGKPCYSVNNGNVVLIVPFKDTCALLFAKGALLNDTQGLLVRPTENTQAARQFRFTTVEQINQLKSTIKDYIQQAVEVEKAGLEVDYSQNRELVFPQEFQNKMDENPELKRNFEALTPGRRRAYYLYFTAPKLSKTRESRVEKCIPQILEGKGLNDL